VLDVAVFLLLVSAAVGTVAYAPVPVSSGPDARETASVLATTTATVDYDLRQQSRQSHGTVGTLLGRAAVANATLDRSTLTPMAEPFRDAVRATTIETLRYPNRTHVRAVWRPYPDAPVQGRFSAGTTPPSGVDVALATITVPAPVDATDARVPVGRSGYRRLAKRVSRSVTASLLPSTDLGASVGRHTPTAVVSTARYRAFGKAVGISVDQAVSRGDIRTAHRTVTHTLTERLEGDIQRRFDSAADATNAVQTGTVTLAVRRWPA
jgi:hypothetical protein